MRLVWAPFALTDRDHIFTHIEADSPGAAIRIDERIGSAARCLLDFPESGRPGRITGTRELVIQRTPYILVYAVTDDTVRILRCLHGAQMWPDEIDLDRLV